MSYSYLSIGSNLTADSPLTAFNAWYDALMHPWLQPIVANNYHWVEDMALPRTSNPLACPPFIFTGPP